MSGHVDESGHYPDLCGIGLVAAFVVWRSSIDGGASSQVQRPDPTDSHSITDTVSDVFSLRRISVIAAANHQTV